jgi:hypothetical protein
VLDPGSKCQTQKRVNGTRAIASPARARGHRPRSVLGMSVVYSNEQRSKWQGGSTDVSKVGIFDGGRSRFLGRKIVMGRVSGNCCFTLCIFACWGGGRM